MTAAEFVAELQQLGVRVWDEAGEQLHYRAPKGVMTPERLAALREHKQALLEFLRAGPQVTVLAQPDARYEPFPLTEIQSAYLIGRRDVVAYGGVACHAYGELAFAELDPARLERAWQLLIARHDMLRAVIHADGFQRVLPDVPAYHLRVDDVRGASADDVAEAVAITRHELDHQVRAPGEWPLFELRATLADERALLHVSIDFLIADYVSIFVLLDEMRQLYDEPERALPPLEITFRDYLMAERALRSGPRYETDRAYWWGRIDDLPARPQLPAVSPASGNAAARFRRWQASFASPEWDAFRRTAAGEEITPSVAVLAAYAETVARWSRHQRFTLNVTMLQRLPLHRHVDALVGDFTSVNLLAVDGDTPASFRDRAHALQVQLWEDIDHRLCSGVEVMREIARRRGPEAAIMPVVFTSAIGLTKGGGGNTARAGMGEIGHGISQTPQVWIDCQVMERDGALAVNWDVRDGVFPDGLVDDMFGAFVDAVRRLSRDELAWTSASAVELPAAQRRRRAEANATEAPLPDGLLHQELIAQALRTPDRTAVVCEARVLTYGDLVRRAGAVARALHAAGCAQGDVVAIVMPTGADQIVAVLAALLCGATYVAVNVDQPARRRDAIIADATARYVMTERGADVELPSGSFVLAVDEVVADASDADASAAPSHAAPDDPAYVMYTSGSTGTPKGVVVSHRSARNTIDDVTRRFAVDARDRVLGLSSLAFDLSVYDVFGPLAVGGTLVLPAHDRRADPSHWAQLVAEHGITVWNSVPAQLHMLDDYLSRQPHHDVTSLRLALLSGDWIPVALPDRIRRRVPGIEIVSLGGATEAAIWSIFHRIGDVRPDQTSIPYGKPLANQTFHVLDAQFRPCPEWTAGELFIGGAGLALGYFGDPAKTAERFVRDPHTAQRLYRTGDMGRYRPDGNIEFLGREDLQVKIRGHRVELAEIETALRSHPGVAGAVVLADGEPPHERRLAAFVESTRRRPGETTVCDDVAEAAGAAGAAATAGIERERYLAYARELDRIALFAMVRALRALGLFAHRHEAHTLDEITAAVTPAHRRLIRRWVRALEANGVLAYSAAHDRHELRDDLDDAALDAAWRRVEALRPASDDESALLDYFRTSSQRLPDLLCGRLDPTALLFPHGRLDVSSSLYAGALFNRWANLVAAAAVERIAAASGARPLRVLEVGAGSGGTTAAVLERLGGFDVEYVFTDVSQFFLNAARERFARAPVHFAVLDLNADYRAQGFAPNTFDVVVAGDVLHSAAHVGRALDRLRELTAPGGWLVMLEMTRDHYQIMTSLELMVGFGGATDFEDERRGRDEIFLTRAQWERALARAGADAVTSLPQNDELMAEIGMHVFAARFKADRVRLDVQELRTYLGERLPHHMLPAHVEIVDGLPLTANGKHDRAVLRAWLPQRDRDVHASAAGPPPTDLERRIAAVWSEVLSVHDVGCERDFFELGGDSLLAAQLAGRLIEEVPAAAGLFFDDMLREILSGPTVSSLAAMLTATAHAADTATPAQTPKQTSSPLIALGGPSDGVAHVFVHDAGGTLQPYDVLVRAMAGTRLIGLAVTDPDRYLELEPAVLVERVAGDYARRLLDDGHARLSLIGYGFGGLLATAVARDLSEAGALVERLTVIDGMPGRGGAHDGAAAAAGVAPGDLTAHSVAAAAQYDGVPYAGNITLVRSQPWPVDTMRYWTAACLGDLDVVDLAPDGGDGLTASRAAQITHVFSSAQAAV